jgi:hypothetical protein
MGDRDVIKLLSWNVNGRTGREQGRQITAALRREADVLALQEITRQSYDAWTDRLVANGYSVVSTVDLAALPHPGTEEWGQLPEGMKRLGPRPRRYFNLTAARGAVAALPGLSFEDK